MRFRVLQPQPQPVLLLLQWRVFRYKLVVRLKCIVQVYTYVL